MGFSDFLDKVKDAIGFGPDSWEERLLPTCDLISPSGREFSPSWRGDPRSIEKKLGVFSFPKIKGSVVQDMEVSASEYNLTLYFGGKDSDLASASFFEALRERGVWKISHPQYGGPYGLQLVSATEDIQPISSGGVTVFKTKWLEPIDPATLSTTAEKAGLIKKLRDDLNLAAASQYTNNIIQTASSFTQAIEDTVDVAVFAIQKGTAPLYETTAALNSAVNSVYRGIQDVKTAATIATESISGQIQNLAQVPARAQKSFSEKIDAFSEAGAGVRAQMVLEASLPPGTSALAKKNAIATLELAELALVGANADAVRFSTPQTREESLSWLELFSGEFDEFLTSLDLGQSIFDERLADEQFISQAETFAIASQLAAACFDFFLSATPDLKIAKRFTLKKPETPISIVLGAYGTLGDDDEILDEFIATNGLTDLDILLLPAGREVVLYV